VLETLGDHGADEPFDPDYWLTHRDAIELRPARAGSGLSRRFSGRVPHAIGRVGGISIEEGRLRWVNIR
jgi:hypothetical protein